MWNLWLISISKSLFFIPDQLSLHREGGVFMKTSISRRASPAGCHRSRRPRARASPDTASPKETCQRHQGIVKRKLFLDLLTKLDTFWWLSSAHLARSRASMIGVLLVLLQASDSMDDEEEVPLEGSHIQLWSDRIWFRCCREKWVPQALFL